MKSHWIPQFYLANWEIEYGKKNEKRVPTWGRVGPDRKIHKSHQPSASICYMDNLYLLELIHAENQQTIETDYLKKLDDRAAKTISKILNGENLSLEERVNFARYLYNLHVRHPRLY